MSTKFEGADPLKKRDWRPDQPCGYAPLFYVSRWSKEVREQPSGKAKKREKDENVLTFFCKEHPTAINPAREVGCW